MKRKQETQTQHQPKESGVENKIRLETCDAISCRFFPARVHYVEQKQTHFDISRPNDLPTVPIFPSNTFIQETNSFY